MKFELCQLSHTYPKAKSPSLSQISTYFESGSITTLLGPNGAGKTTLFKILAGLIQQTHGEILINGIKWAKFDPKPLGHIGYVFQDSTIDRMRTGFANLKYAGQLQGMDSKSAIQRIDELADQFSMSEFIKKSVGALSGGQRRRLEIARAMMHNPTWLFLDEPSVGLDIDSRDQLSTDLHKLSGEKNCGILWCTHIPDELRPSDRVLIMKAGTIRFEGMCSTPDSLIMTYHEVIGS